ncbi:MAG: DUF600 family protein [Clostridia bacterium]|nr:DUF600 family protein [Clostridia bacterium]
MLTTSNIRNVYSQIQKQLFYMIPEKWDSIYLYASIIEHSKTNAGEMFFYYYPKSILQKKPINVYEIPNKFNLDEEAYLKLADKLYAKIKELRNELIKIKEQPFTSITISVKNYKFNVEYDYEDLTTTEYTSYDRHLIWRHKYLKIPLSNYNRKEKQMIIKYLEGYKEKNKNLYTYTEGIYKKEINSNIIEYNHEERQIQKEAEEEIKQEQIKSQILSYKQINE